MLLSESMSKLVKKMRKTRDSAKNSKPTSKAKDIAIALNTAGRASNKTTRTGVDKKSK